jgi:hypothetical protein
MAMAAAFSAPMAGYDGYVAVEVEDRACKGSL